MRYLLLALTFVALSLQAETLSAAQYIAAVKAGAPQGTILIRARFEQRKGEEKTGSLNVTIKRRTTADGAHEQLYTVTFAKDPALKGARLLVRTKDGKELAGSVFVPGQPVRSLSAADRTLPVFGTDMTVEDLITDFFGWTTHTQTGTEKVGNNDCVIIESTSGQRKVKSWVEAKRYIPWRVQLFDDQGKPAREVLTTKVMRAKTGYWLPTAVTISTLGAGTSTEFTGTGADTDITFTDADFGVGK
jgi:hypothetical protein